MQKTDLEQAVHKGLRSIQRLQHANGGFYSYSSPDKNQFSPQITYQSTFVPSLILSALAQVGSKISIAICAPLADYVASQASAAGSFNYWAKRSPERQTMPYPDDLDDTFCALAGLFLYDSSYIDETMLAKAVKLLVAAESNVGGPYRTWLVSKKSEPEWQDVDLAVNANVAYFLSLVSNPLPNLMQYIDTAILNDHLSSPYYPSRYPLLYFISRGYAGRERKILVIKIREALRAASNSMEKSLCLTALINVAAFHESDRAHIRQLLHEQQGDGSWPAAAFCVDPEIEGQTYYGGAAALTTALVVESLFRYSQLNHVRKDTAVAPLARNVRANPVLRVALSQCASLPSELKKPTRAGLQKIVLTNNGPEIMALPDSFNQSLNQPLRGHAKTIQLLGAANLYGWLAYTIFDDFIDEEGQPKLLPVATTALRRSILNFNQAVSATDFQAFVQQVFDTIDSANAWELAHCRFVVENNTVTIGELPDYQQLEKLGERSLGHSLGPLTVLYLGGTRPSSPAFQHTHQAFVHYLIAKQLNDDLHDWEQDLGRGHITHVVQALLKRSNIAAGEYSIKELQAKLRPVFWQSVLPEICTLMQKQVIAGRKAVQKVEVLSDNSILDQLLTNIESSVKDSLAKQRQSKQFLSQYGGKK